MTEKTDGVDGGTLLVVEVIVVVVLGFDVAHGASFLPIFMNDFEFTGVWDAVLDGGFPGLHDFHADVFFQSSNEELVFNETFQILNTFPLDCYGYGYST